MAIEVQAPDGTLVDFPDDTPDEVMTKVMRENYGFKQPETPPPAEAAPQPAPQGLQNGAGGLGAVPPPQGATPVPAHATEAPAAPEGPSNWKTLGLGLQAGIAQYADTALRALMTPHYTQVAPAKVAARALNRLGILNTGLSDEDFNGVLNEVDNDMVAGMRERRESAMTSIAGAEALAELNKAPQKDLTKDPVGWLAQTGARLLAGVPQALGTRGTSKNLAGIIVNALGYVGAAESRALDMATDMGIDDMDVARRMAARYAPTSGLLNYGQSYSLARLKGNTAFVSAMNKLRIPLNGLEEVGDVRLMQKVMSDAITEYNAAHPEKPPIPVPQRESDLSAFARGAVMPAAYDAMGAATRAIARGARVAYTAQRNKIYNRAVDAADAEREKLVSSLNERNADAATLARMTKRAPEIGEALEKVALEYQGVRTFGSDEERMMAYSGPSIKAVLNATPEEVYGKMLGEVVQRGLAPDTEAAKQTLAAVGIVRPEDARNAAVAVHQKVRVEARVRELAHAFEMPDLDDRAKLSAIREIGKTGTVTRGNLARILGIKPDGAEMDRVMGEMVEAGLAVRPADEKGVVSKNRLQLDEQSRAILDNIREAGEIRVAEERAATATQARAVLLDNPDATLKQLKDYLNVSYAKVKAGLQELQDQGVLPAIKMLKAYNEQESFYRVVDAAQRIEAEGKGGISKGKTADVAKLLGVTQDVAERVKQAVTQEFLEPEALGKPDVPKVEEATIAPSQPVNVLDYEPSKMRPLRIETRPITQEDVDAAATPYKASRLLIERGWTSKEVAELWRIFGDTKSPRQAVLDYARYNSPEDLHFVGRAIQRQENIRPISDAAIPRAWRKLMKVNSLGAHAWAMFGDPWIGALGERLNLDASIEYRNIKSKVDAIFDFKDAPTSKLIKAARLESDLPNQVPAIINGQRRIISVTKGDAMYMLLTYRRFQAEDAANAAAGNPTTRAQDYLDQFLYKEGGHRLAEGRAWFRGGERVGNIRFDTPEQRDTFLRNNVFTAENESLIPVFREAIDTVITPAIENAAKTLGVPFEAVNDYISRMRDRQKNFVERDVPGPLRERILKEMTPLKRATSSKEPLVIMDAVESVKRTAEEVGRLSAMAVTEIRMRQMLDIIRKSSIGPRYGRTDDPHSVWEAVETSINLMVDPRMYTRNARGPEKVLRGAVARMYPAILSLNPAVRGSQLAAMYPLIREFGLEPVMRHFGIFADESGFHKSRADTRPLVESVLEVNGLLWDRIFTSRMAASDIAGPVQAKMNEWGMKGIHDTDRQSVLATIYMSIDEGRARGLTGDALIEYASRRASEVTMNTQPTGDAAFRAMGAETSTLGYLFMGMFQSAPNAIRSKMFTDIMYASNKALPKPIRVEHAVRAAEQMFAGIVLPAVHMGVIRSAMNAGLVSGTAAILLKMFGMWDERDEKEAKELNERRKESMSQLIVGNSVQGIVGGPGIGQGASILARMMMASGSVSKKALNEAKQDLDRLGELRVFAEAQQGFEALFAWSDYRRTIEDLARGGEMEEVEGPEGTVEVFRPFKANQITAKERQADQYLSRALSGAAGVSAKIFPKAWYLDATRRFGVLQAFIKKGHAWARETSAKRAAAQRNAANARSPQTQQVGVQAAPATVKPVRPPNGPQVRDLPIETK